MMGLALPLHGVTGMRNVMYRCVVGRGLQLPPRPFAAEALAAAAVTVSVTVTTAITVTATITTTLTVTVTVTVTISAATTVPVATAPAATAAAMCTRLPAAACRQPPLAASPHRVGPHMTPARSQRAGAALAPGRRVAARRRRR